MLPCKFRSIRETRLLCKQLNQTIYLTDFNYLILCIHNDRDIFMHANILKVNFHPFILVHGSLISTPNTTPNGHMPTHTRKSLTFLPRSAHKHSMCRWGNFLDQRDYSSTGLQEPRLTSDMPARLTVCLPRSDCPRLCLHICLLDDLLSSNNLTFR